MLIRVSSLNLLHFLFKSHLVKSFIEKQFFANVTCELCPQHINKLRISYTLYISRHAVILNLQQKSQQSRAKQVIARMNCVCVPRMQEHAKNKNNQYNRTDSSSNDLSACDMDHHDSCVMIRHNHLLVYCIMTPP